MVRPRLAQTVDPGQAELPFSVLLLYVAEEVARGVVGCLRLCFAQRLLAGSEQPISKDAIDGPELSATRAAVRVSEREPLPLVSIAANGRLRLPGDGCKTSQGHRHAVDRGLPAARGATRG